MERSAGNLASASAVASWRLRLFLAVAAVGLYKPTVFDEDVLEVAYLLQKEERSIDSCVLTPS